MSKPDLAVPAMSDDLRRQRKFLIIINVILLFMKFGEVTITKIALSGLQMTIGNINAIYLLLWGIWIYFLLRFYNQYRLEGLYLFNEAWRNSGDHTIMYKMKDIIHRFPVFEAFDRDITFSAIRYVGKRFVVSLDAPDAHRKQDFEIPRNLIWKYKIKTFKYLLKNHTQLLDYYFPFVFSFITLIYCGFSRWDGSILKLIGIW